MTTAGSDGKVNADVRGATLYFDCASGIAGDMTVGALVDLGVPEVAVTGELAKLPVKGYRVELARVMRGGMSGAKFRVILDEKHPHQHAHVHEHLHEQPHEHLHEQPHEHLHEHSHGYGVGGHSEESHGHVHYGEIRSMLVASGLSAGVKARALSMFDAIAEVEARLHGVDVKEVAFHEVGAVDSIVDIVGAAAALEWLRPVRVVSRRVPLGRGRVRTAHGLLPIPAPATLALLEGAPVEEGGIDGELTTPTGAVILRANATAWGALPAMEILGVGYGAGDRELADRPNLLRVIAGREAVQASADERVIVEANIDDMSPELLAPLLEALLAAGAADAWLTPILMKKGRPGFVVAALVEEVGRVAVEETLLRESTSIGVRRHAVERTTLPRRIIEVETRFGKVLVKVAGEGASANIAPEFESCRRVAAERSAPLKQVYAEALAAYYAGTR